MVSKTMLIDASHPEETRVVVLSGNRLEDFDVEVESRKRLKGNIYLAKVTRVEPSLQAAFVDYGGDRHGFLSFSEIHPDYYQIPIEDRQALVAEHDAAEKADADSKSVDGGEAEGEELETIGGDDSEEVEAHWVKPSLRRYKIQEVIKRRQVMLIQVVKEERGHKGAALTTYISLAGRYCVLMPNTARGGGISRKITNSADRKRLKSVLGDLGIPEGVAVIVRTAGINRSKAEIKRDYEYLMRLWDGIRNLTLQSMAPAPIHEEGNLIKRAIRDIYSRDIGEIIVDGDAAYRMAKDFMKLMIASHAKRVKKYRETGKSLMHHYHVESQLDAIHSPEIQLKSGGYIVFSPTEALVAIDVNSGRSTKERNIEETALKTNLEAADEIARQLRLRDLAGLIVIDFIDMEVRRNNTKVERQLKEAMRNDRARIQMGRISLFGLLELSRQRLRPSLIETSSEPCPHCSGTGIRRSTESAALNILRAIEEKGNRNRSKEIIVHVSTEVALYILNQKRATLADIESRYGFTVNLSADDSLIPPNHRIERVKAPPIKAAAVPIAGDEGLAASEKPQPDGGEESPKRHRRRGRRRRKSVGEGQEATIGAEKTGAAVEAVETPLETAAETATGETDESKGKRRRRGRRGGRRRSRKSPDRRVETGKPGIEAERQRSEDAGVDISLLSGPAEAIFLQPPVGEPILLGSAVDEAEAALAEAKTKNGSSVQKRRTARRAVGKRKQKEAAAKTEAETKIDGPKPEPAEKKSKRTRTKTKTKPKPKSQRKDKTVDAADDAAAKGKAAAAKDKTEAGTDETNAGKTTVIDVGADKGREQPESRRQGWWQRFGG
ncbi:MAG: ribonuclease E/G [Rhodospirillales bacterium]